MIKIFNTLTKKKEQFESTKSNTINIYVCGVTVYDLCHLGHARTFVVFDIVVRYLNYCGYQVNYVRNITDIDDKIIQKAHNNHETIDQLTDRFIQHMHFDLDQLNIIRPTYEPKVTDYIDTIINFIQLLIKKKHAYVTLNGDVVFSLKTAYNYGVLSNRILHKKDFKNQNLYNFYSIKENPKDFLLWKSSKPGEPFWTAPWSKGRPGWHIECSAISHSVLGNHIDIHGGGSDLIFPHHENEIAQSYCAHNTFRVHTWMHVGMLLQNHSKMSKSSKNFFTIQESLNQYDPETIRFYLLSAHYRNQLQYDKNNLKNARIAVEHLYIALRDVNLSVDQPTTTEGEYFISQFINKMNDDFNTPKAYSVLFELAHTLNVSKKNKNHVKAQSLASTLKKLANILGILYQNPETYLKSELPFKTNDMCFSFEKIQELVNIREHARYHGQWELADKIRSQLKKVGIILEDYSTGKTKWRRSSYLIEQ